VSAALRHLRHASLFPFFVCDLKVKFPSSGGKFISFIAAFSPEERFFQGGTPLPFLLLYPFLLSAYIFIEFSIN